jgi:ribonuclease HI
MPTYAFGSDAPRCDAAVHYLLFSEARVEVRQGIWRFVLAQVGTSDSLSATDVEPIACRERLELLAVVRGLEAIDQPARVTLVTGSRYVSRGLKRGLADWRAADWQWERFGQLVAVRDHDLWRRVDRALQFHRLDCRLWHLDGQTTTDPVAAPAERMAPTTGQRLAQAARKRWRKASQVAAAWGDALHGAPGGLAAG